MGAFYPMKKRGEEVLGRPYVVCDRAYGDCEIFPPDEDGMTLPQRDGHRESDMDSAIGSMHSSEASDLCRGDDKEEGLGGLFLPTDKQLFHNSNFSSSNGSTEDLFRDSIDSCENDITEKVSSLEKKVTELENESSLNGDLKGKLKQENTQLVHRVHELEEQIKDQEARAEQVLEEEIKRHREAYVKMEREKSTEIELLNNRVQQLEDENGAMGSSVNRLKSQTEKLDEERQRMTYKLEDTSLRLKDEMDLYKKMMDKLRQNRHDSLRTCGRSWSTCSCSSWRQSDPVGAGAPPPACPNSTPRRQNRHEFQKEREATQELIEDLRKELEHLQLFKLETERPGRGRSASSSLSEFNAKTREMELEHEIKRLKQENQKLREQNDDLNGQILSLSLYEAKNLFATHTKAQSLAAEIDNASRDEIHRAPATPVAIRAIQAMSFASDSPCTSDSCGHQSTCGSAVEPFRSVLSSCTIGLMASLWTCSAKKDSRERFGGHVCLPPFR
ncbi:UNVERIFIED_CONTAM: hypothetical protein FKN15_014341 [Acipenser sinensis]